MAGTKPEINLRDHIEHTLLKPDTSGADIEQLCREAIQYGFVAVCVPPYYVAYAAEILAESGIELATVVGFPFGYQHVMSKFEEIENAMAAGANHLDTVINIAAVKNNDWDTVETEMETLTRLVHAEQKVIKCIFETGLLNEIETDLLCKIANACGVDYVKTSTGIQSPGANVEVVRTLRSLLLPSVKIKASGGIRTRQFALELMDAGASRIGTSSGIAIMEEEAAEKSTG